jgi:hypothetical protein
VTGSERRYETAKWPTLWLLLAFLAIAATGVVTVLLPELEDEPEPAEEASHTEPLQE